MSFVSEYNLGRDESTTYFLSSLACNSVGGYPKDDHIERAGFQGFTLEGVAILQPTKQPCGRGLIPE
jgi:hypothetical protein